jgi:hypothetical protein
VKKDEVFNVELDGFELMKFDGNNFGMKFWAKGKGGFGIVRLSREELGVVAVSALHELLGVKVSPQIQKS